MINHWENMSLEDIKNEIWEDVIYYDNKGNRNNYNGLYKVSNFGRIKTLERQDTGKGYGLYFREQKIKKQCIGTNGYLYVVLCKERLKRTCMIHRAVAIAFIKNPENKKCVNHKNGDKMDNRCSELEWVTYSQNMYHAFEHGLLQNPKGIDNVLSKKVRQLTKDNIEIRVFDSVTEAANSVSVRGGNISAVCKGVRNSIAGYKWEYVN